MNEKIKICAIAAMSENRAIGRDGDLPWHIPEDLKHFKRMTTGKPVIMGRKTFESIGSKPLPKRLNIIVSRHDVPGEGFTSTRTIEEAITLAKEQATKDGVNEIMICGGAQIYELAMRMTDRLYLTIVHQHVADGDTFFPTLNENEWRETQRDDHAAYSFVTMERK